MASERKFIAENIRRVLLKEYFIRETQMAGFGGIDIQRTPMGTRITLTVERPGMVIGRKGAKIKDLTRTVSDVYGFDNPQIEVQECAESSSNPQIMAQKLAHSLERGWHFRRAGHSTIRRIQDTDVKGCQVKLSGKLTGQRHRTEKFKWGNIKFCGEPALTTMDRGYAIAKKKLGLIGVSVDIMKKDSISPDDVYIKHIPDLKNPPKEESEKPEIPEEEDIEAEEKKTPSEAEVKEPEQPASKKETGGKPSPKEKETASKKETEEKEEESKPKKKEDKETTSEKKEEKEKDKPPEDKETTSEKKEEKEKDKPPNEKEEGEKPAGKDVEKGADEKTEKKPAGKASEKEGDEKPPSKSPSKSEEKEKDESDSEPAGEKEEKKEEKEAEK